MLSPNDLHITLSLRLVDVVTTDNHELRIIDDVA
jgi:hypothetical protein